MRNTILALGLSIILSSASFAQTTDSKATSTVKNSTSVTKNGNGATLESGTQIAAQLQNSLDVKKAKVGDQVLLKATKSIKQNGQVVVNKGASLMGRVTEVQQKTKGSAMSKVSVVFDSMQNGKMMMPISATITSITQANANFGNSSDIMGSSSTGTQTQSGGGSSGGGGLLGGVGSTVGSVVNTTTNTVGGVTNSVGQTVGGTLKGIQITQSTDVSAEGSSTLSLTGGNLKLEKGTTFNLRVSESSSVKTLNQ